MPRRPILAAGLVLPILAAVDSVSAGQEVVRITKADCMELVKHVPAPDAAYRPGVDLRGRPVAPADLNGGARFQPPDDLLIEIDIDLFERLGIPPDPGNFSAEAVAGVVEVRDGQAYFNGEPLGDRAQSDLAAKCRNAMEGNG